MDTPVAQLDQLPYYEQDSGANITYQFVVRPGSMGLMSSGRVRATGPTRKALDHHDGWDQIYIILAGKGTVLLDGREYPVSAGSVARIPRGTEHGVALAEGESLEYVYVNAFRDQAALDTLLKTQ